MNRSNFEKQGGCRSSSYTLGVAPGDRTAQKAVHRWLLPVHRDLDVSQSGGVVHGDMDQVY